MTPQPPVSPVGELSEEDFALEACQQGGFDSLDAAREFVRRVKASALREAAKVARDLKGGFTIEVTSGRLLPDEDGLWHLGADVAKAIEDSQR